VLLMTVWQNEAQVEELYGPAKARTILANHLWKIYLPGSTDEATLKSLSEQIGTYQHTETTISTGPDGRTSTSHRLTDTPAAPVTDLQTMPTDTAIAISGRRRPIRLRTRGWYQDPAQRALIDPVVAAQFDTDFAPSTASLAAQRPKAGTARDAWPSADRQSGTKPAARRAHRIGKTRAR
jgi:type IV secretory pathway TraG/TraD family ATPase VirD4